MGNVSAEQFSRVGDQYLGISYNVMDCQSFVERCMADVGISMDLAGSNAWYRKMTWVGTPEECKQKFRTIPKGAILFILENDGGEVQRGYHDGLGNASHMGIYTNRGKGAIHSSQSRGCVCESEFHGKTIPNGGWNRIGLWDRFDYGDSVNSILSGFSESANEGDGKPMGHIATVTSENGKGVNMRSNPSTNAAVLIQLPVGTKVDATEVDADWSKIVYNGKTGYMMSKFLTTENDDEVTIRLPRELALVLYEQLNLLL